MSGCSGKPDGPDVTLVMGWGADLVPALFRLLCSPPGSNGGWEGKAAESNLVRDGRRGGESRLEGGELDWFIV